MGERTPIYRSLLFHVAAIVIGAFVVLIIAAAILVQTTVLFRVLPGTISPHARAIGDLAHIVNTASAEDADRLVNAFSMPGRASRILSDFPPDARDHAVMEQALKHSWAKAGMGHGDRVVKFRMMSLHKLLTDPIIPRRPDLFGASALEVTIALDDDRVLAVWLTPAALLIRPTMWFFLSLVTMIILIAGVAARFIASPLKDLERVAQQIGQTSKPVTVVEAGPEDMRRVARALNYMQRRIEALLAERSKMVAAVAHDIRTGLTRMRLRVDQLDDSRLEVMLGDLTHLENLVNDMMTYARSEQPAEALELVEIGHFLQTFIGRQPSQVTLIGEPVEFTIVADPAALLRAFSNLADNARVYAGALEIRMIQSAEGLEIFFEDRGPGLPEEQLEAVFDAFYRGDPSRNRETGGSGLGLTIARALLCAQGATLSLSNRPEGGLSARIVFSETLHVT